jgi:RhtB (resistance to homoserine/threonine) family protein
MLSQFFTIGFLMLFSAMLPGPDFALVTKNTLMHSRRSGIFTTLGITAAVLIHLSYCALGLALVIAHSAWLFNIIKYLGAAYLIYLGINSLSAKQSSHIVDATHAQKKSSISDISSFRQGFLCNILNPKATLFFLALFTMIIKPDTPRMWMMIYLIEMLIIATAWFCTLTFILSHPHVTRLLEKSEKYISKLLGVFLIGLGILLII